MTVEQLIAALATFSPQLRVIMPGERTDVVDVDAAFIDLVRFDGGGMAVDRRARRGSHPGGATLRS